jgi:hypothetical protein
VSPEQVTATELAGEPITATLTSAPGYDAPIGGLKVVTGHAWFAARPSGTEDVYKIYAESFKGPDHLAKVQRAARELVSAALAGAGAAGQSAPPPAAANADAKSARAAKSTKATKAADAKAKDAEGAKAADAKAEAKNEAAADRNGSDPEAKNEAAAEPEPEASTADQS